VPYTSRVAAPTAAPPAPSVPVPEAKRRLGAFMSSLRPVWSKPAAYRALRVTLVMPALFAFTSQVVGNLQMATFAAFGSFATLLFASFGGRPRDKVFAHTLLAVAGSALIVIGSAISFNTAVAAVVTVPVAFCVLFAGIAGPNAASGAVAALVAFVLPATSRAPFSVVPDRLAGWWLASVFGTIAVLVLSPRPPGDRLRASAAKSAGALADELDSALARKCTDTDAQAAMAAKLALINVFDGSPFRPTGLAVPDQALANLVESLEWCTTLVAEALRDGTDLTTVAEVERRLFAESAAVLRDTARVLGGTDVPGLVDNLHKLESTVAEAGDAILDDDGPGEEEAVHASFHARLVAAASISCASDALIATRRADPDIVAAELSRWQGDPEGSSALVGRAIFVSSARRLLSGHASLRSVLFLNSAVAVAVAVADVTNVQHGFWVVLGTVSVLRTNAASTGATALRALGGTVVGFFIGAVLILAVGSDTTALWVALPIAVLIASYAPGTFPFAIGQAFFTVTVSILFNILVPVGWKVGVVRLEDVAIGAGVSAIVGALFWPRGASKIVADDLADAFHRGGLYLVQATAWALGIRPALPDAGTGAILAASRLDDALRAFMAEQGSKKVPQDQVWRLVGGARRLRLTAESLTVTPRPEPSPGLGRHVLVEDSVKLAGMCDELAGRLSRTSSTVAQELVSLPGPTLPTPDGQEGYLLWVREHLLHVKRDLASMVEPVETIAARRAEPWWR
jgi:Fusaric acid resistance protein-like